VVAWRFRDEHRTEQNLPEVQDGIESSRSTGRNRIFQKYRTEQNLPEVQDGTESSRSTGRNRIFQKYRTEPATTDRSTYPRR